MEKWFEEAESNAVPGAKMYLVGSKSDKTANRTVKFEEGQRLAELHGAPFCELSSKTRDNVKKPFVEIVDLIVADKELLASGTRRGGRGTVQLGAAETAAGGCSC